MGKPIKVGAVVGALLGLVGVAVLLIFAAFALWFGCHLTLGGTANCPNLGPLDILFWVLFGIVIGAICGSAIAKIIFR